MIAGSAYLHLVLEQEIHSFAATSKEEHAATAKLSKWGLHRQVGPSENHTLPARRKIPSQRKNNEKGKKKEDKNTAKGEVQLQCNCASASQQTNSKRAYTCGLAAASSEARCCRNARRGAIPAPAATRTNGGGAVEGAGGEGWDRGSGGRWKRGAGRWKTARVAGLMSTCEWKRYIASVKDKQK